MHPQRNIHSLSDSPPLSAGIDARAGLSGNGAKRRSPSGAAAEQRARARCLLEAPIDFIGRRFRRDWQDDQVIAEARLAERAVAQSVAAGDAACPPRGLSGYLRSLYETRLMTPDEERDAFCRMNHLKHRASTLRESLDPSRPSAVLMDQIERLLAAALAVRDQILRCNLRLVVSIAKKLAQGDQVVEDLVSEGNVALFRAVEKFDVARGFRFSTYATHAIRRHLWRLVMKRNKELARAAAEPDKILALMSDGRDEPEVGEDRITPALAVMGQVLGDLDRREQFIVRARFGLTARGESQTLQSLARELGVCKERVRQLEIRALRKLRAAVESERVTAAVFDG